MPLRVVCFSCGNSIKYLRQIGIDVVGVGPGEMLRPAKWHTYTEVARSFGMFDATSGHLPAVMMWQIAQELRQTLDTRMQGIIELDMPTGSGETLVCFKMAFPAIAVHAVRGISPGTEYSPEAPLNQLVNLLQTYRG